MSTSSTAKTLLVLALSVACYLPLVYVMSGVAEAAPPTPYISPYIPYTTYHGEDDEPDRDTWLGTSTCPVPFHPHTETPC